MRKLESIIKAIESEDAKILVDEVLIYLRSSISKVDIGYLIKLISSKSALALFENSEVELDGLRELFIKKYIDVILKRGDIAEQSHLNIYPLFQNSKKNDLLAPYIDYIEKIKVEIESDIERVFLANLECMVLTLGGYGKEAIKGYIKNILVVNTHKLDSIKFIEPYLTFLESCALDMEDILDALKELLCKESYLLYSPESRRSIFNNSLHIIWNIPKYYNNPKWKNLYPLWRELFYAHLLRAELDEAMYIEFYIYHKMGNHFQTQAEWREFNSEITRYAIPYFQNYQKNNLPNRAFKCEDKKIKTIGILKDRVVDNAPFRVEYSLLKSLLKDSSFKERFEIKLYIMSYIEKSENDKILLQKLQNLGISIYDVGKSFYKDGFYNSHLKKALTLKERIESDGVDILISPNNGYAIADFILSSRSAPLQIFWSHGNFVYDIEGIDRRVTHIHQKRVELEGYEFFGFSVDMGSDSESLDLKAFEKERAKYPKDVFILGTIGRLIKLDNRDYLESIAKILHKNPNTIYIAAGSGNIESIEKELRELGVWERFYFCGFVDARVYGEIIDMWINTFPLGQGESFNEYLKLKKPFVTLIEANREWIERNRSSDRRFCYPYTRELFVEYATKLIQDRELRDRCVEIYKSERAKALKAPFLDAILGS